MEKDELDTLILKAKLMNETCALEHEEKKEATAYIRQKFSFFEIIIPVCKECIEKLKNDDWILLYCVECCNSKWVYKSDSNHKHLYQEGEHIRWMKICPVCYISEYENIDTIIIEE